MKSILLVSVALATLAVSPSAIAAPLQISANDRYLVDGEGRPFLLTGDSAWSLMVEPTLEEAQTYLLDRAARGFNFVVVNLIEKRFATNAPLNAYGEAPFLDDPFTTPNEAYFAHVDSIVEFAGPLGIVLMLSPVYVGYRCGDQGWCVEMQEATLEEMRDWGRFVGQRYGGYDHVLWSIGGDADPEPVKTELREFVAGLREFDPDNLITAHNHRDTQAVTYWPGEPWLQVNNVFSTRDALYQSTTDGYLHTPAMPLFMLEGFYENEHGATALQLRAQSYWTVLTGGCGVVFGNCPLWHFGYSSSWCGLTNWEVQLDNPGSLQMTHYRALFESRRWWQLVPDLDHDVLIAGAGTDGSEAYATAAAAADGSSIVVYAPDPRTMSVDATVLTGSTVRVWWFDPADGSSGLVGDVPNGTVEIASWGSGDRVFVLDDGALAFGAPGTPLPLSGPPSRTGARLEQNTPNPFNPGTTIRYAVPGASRVRITVYDARGRAVRALVDRIDAGGAHSARWDGRDDEGVSMPSGVYYYRMRSKFGSDVKRMVLLR